MKRRKLISSALAVLIMCGAVCTFTPFLSSDTSAVELYSLPSNKTAFPKVYNITAVANDSSLGTVVGGETQLDDGVEISLTAFPAESAAFEYWEDSQGNKYKANPLVFKPKADETFTAYFRKNSFSITIKAANGGKVTGGGSYKSGAEATLTFVPDDNCSFDYWQDSSGNKYANNPLTVTVSEDMTYTAYQTIDLYDITVEYNNEHGTVEGAGTYSSGSVYTLTAAPNTGYQFDGWTDDDNNALSDELIYTGTITANTTLKANFSPIQCDVNIAAVNGSVQPTSGKYSYGESIVLKAVPNDGYIFDHWEKGGEFYSANDIITYTVALENELAAVFKEKEQPPVKPLIGDVNLDGAVDMLDDIALSRYVAGWDGITVDAVNSDINKDGSISMVDSVILSRCIAGWSGYETYLE